HGGDRRGIRRRTLRPIVEIGLHPIGELHTVRQLFVVNHRRRRRVRGSAHEHAARLDRGAFHAIGAVARDGPHVGRGPSGQIGPVQGRWRRATRSDDARLQHSVWSGRANGVEVHALGGGISFGGRIALGGRIAVGQRTRFGGGIPFSRGIAFSGRVPLGGGIPFGSRIALRQSPESSPC